MKCLGGERRSLAGRGGGGGGMVRKHHVVKLGQTNVVERVGLVGRRVVIIITIVIAPLACFKFRKILRLKTV